MLSQTLRGNKFTICIFTHLSYCCCASFNLLTEFFLFARSFCGNIFFLMEENATDMEENVESILWQCDKFGKRETKEFFCAVDVETARCESRWKIPTCHSAWLIGILTMLTLMYSKQFCSSRDIKLSTFTQWASTRQKTACVCRRFYRQSRYLLREAFASVFISNFDEDCWICQETRTIDERKRHATYWIVVEPRLTNNGNSGNWSYRWNRDGNR